MANHEPQVSLLPSRFRWGVATSSFQIEGAAGNSQRGACIWDDFCRRPGAISDGSNGDQACDHVRRFRDDVRLMSEIGVDAYRFSISWPRVIPEGRGAVNDAGLDFYDNLIDALLAAKIEPMVTLYHWDLPSALQRDIGGWECDDIAYVFADYAELIFNRFGDRVSRWLTINEPWCVVDGGYFNGVHAPGLKDKRRGYRAGHNMIRAHGHAVARYRSCRNNTGQISFALNMHYTYPDSNDPADVTAAERAMLNFGGWFADPMYVGDYPKVMRERLGDMLPEFSPEDSRLLTRSMDYLALNYYLGDRVRHAPGAGAMELEPIPQPNLDHTEMGWPIMPDGLTRLLVWLHERYDQLPIYITENGAAFTDDVAPNGAVDDPKRIAYLREHLSAVIDAVKRGVDVRGYYLWTLMDNFEWSHGFSKKFGIVHCDCGTLKRTVKASGRWYKDLIRRHRDASTEAVTESSA